MASQPGNENPYQPPIVDTGAPPPKRVGGGKYANCPQCQHNDAARVGFTWWGGALGPWMFTHVKCKGCGAAFNGKTGESNATAIAIYVGVSLVLAVMIFGGLTCAGGL